MPSYELDGSTMTAKTQKKLTELPLQLVFGATQGRVLARTEQVLPRARGIKQIADTEYDALAQEQEIEDAEVGQRGAPSGVGLESASGWDVAPSSPRKHSLKRPRRD